MLVRPTVAGLFTLFSACALAQDAAPDTAGSPAVIRLDLTGTIPTRCGFAGAPGAAAPFGNVAEAGSIALPFTLDCNTPFAMKVASSHGALARNEAITTPNPYTSRIDYAIALSVDTDLATVNARCMVGALTASGCVLGSGLSSGGGIGIGTAGALTLSWTPPRKTPVAGEYSDQITLTVEVRS